MFLVHLLSVFVFTPEVINLFFRQWEKLCPRYISGSSVFVGTLVGGVSVQHHGVNLISPSTWPRPLKSCPFYISQKPYCVKSGSFVGILFWSVSVLDHCMTLS